MFTLLVVTVLFWLVLCALHSFHREVVVLGATLTAR